MLPCAGPFVNCLAIQAHDRTPGRVPHCETISRTQVFFPPSASATLPIDFDRPRTENEADTENGGRNNENCHRDEHGR